MLGACAPAGGAAASAAGGATAPAAASEAPAIRLRRVKSVKRNPPWRDASLLSPIRQQRGRGVASHTQVNTGPTQTNSADPCRNSLVRLRAGRLEDRRPARDLGLQIVREVLWCALVLSRHRAAEIGDALLHTRVIERLVERCAQLL